MQRSRHFFAVALLAAVAACGGKQSPEPAPAPPANTAEAAAPAAETDRSFPDPLPPIPAQPQPVPAALIATVEVGNPAGVLADIGRIVDSVQPGMSAMLTPDLFNEGFAEMLDVRLAGVDYKKPLRMLVFDPTQSPEPVVLVVGVGDEGALQDAVRSSGRTIQVHGGFAAIGVRDAVAQGAPYALTTFISQAPPADPTATLLVAPLVERYRAQIDMSLTMVGNMAASQDPSLGPMVVGMMDLFKGVLYDTKVMRMALELKGEPTIRAEVEPVADSGLAKMAAKQPRSDFSEAALFPDSHMLMVGDMDMKSMFEPMQPMLIGMMRTLYKDKGDALAQLWTRWFDVLGQSMVAGVSYGAPMEMGMMWGVTDAKKAFELMVEGIAMMPKKLDMPTGSFDLQVKKRAFRHRGVSVATWTMKPSKKASAEERELWKKMYGGQLTVHVAAAGKHALMTMGGAKQARELIDIATGKTKPAELSEGRKAAIEDARTRGESFVMLMDMIGAMQGMSAMTGQQMPVPAQAGANVPPMAWGMSFGDGLIKGRMTIPVQQLQIIGAMSMGMAGGAAPPAPPSP